METPAAYLLRATHHPVKDSRQLAVYYLLRKVGILLPTGDGLGKIHKLKPADKTVRTLVDVG